ncbi:MAG TPA: LTA synthase family protein [Steroidobacteraceae bacterium]|nr:LTA synthase family protein [Steroidobacteraceae bacterium]
MPRRFRLIIALALASLAIGAAARALLWMNFGAAAGVGALALPAILAGGLVNDAIVALYLFAPLALYTALLPDRWYRTPANRRVLAVGSWLSLFALVYLAVIEAYFFQEFDSRFNLVAFDYLAYPTEVAGDVWAEYPVIWAALAAAAVATLGLGWMRRCIGDGSEARAGRRERWKPFAAHASAVALAAVFWPTDMLSLADNRVANELVQNGISSFMRAAITSEIDFHANYETGDPRENLALIARELSRGGGRFTHLAEGRLDRVFPARKDGLGRMNVVLISSESFGAEFSRLYGSREDLTPNFDGFAQKGIWFPHAYASGTRTVRGLEALTTSIPPIPTVSILRRPGNENIATWGAVMRSLGYHTSFLYGGYGYFDNMNAFYEGNGFEIQDRRAIQAVRFENIWGVADEDLFDHALGHFDRLHGEGKPFFSIVMTTSNHKPFTFRQGLEQYGIPAEGGGRPAGVRYADYALGQFLRAAESHPWFEDTVFVFAADHGARVYGREQIPLKTYEIPLMIYAPKRIRPRRVETLMTQIDVAPTVLGLLGLPYEAPFFGQDVLHAPADGRVAFFNHNHDVAVYREGEIVVFGLKKSVHTYRYDEATDSYRPAPADPELERLGLAYFQTAYELFEARRYLPAPAPSRPARIARGN